MKELINRKHKALELEKGGFCKPNQGSLYTHLFNEQFDAHDALEDVTALRRIIFDSSLNLSRKTIVENSNVTAVSHALKNTLYLDRCHELLQIFRNKLFNEAMKTVQLLNPWLRTLLVVVSPTMTFVNFTQPPVKGA